MDLPGATEIERSKLVMINSLAPLKPVAGNLTTRYGAHDVLHSRRITGDTGETGNR